MAKTLTRTWAVPTNKIDDEIKVRNHFGWEILAKTTTSITMTKEVNSICKRLASLERQYDHIIKKAPIAGIVYSIIGLIFIVTGLIITKEFMLFYFAIGIGLLLILLGLVYLLRFFIILPYRKKMIQELFDSADQIRGAKKTLPLPANLKPTDQHSFHIKEAIYDGDLDIRY